MTALLASIHADVDALADEGDELLVIRIVLDRLQLGRRQYGALRASDPRRAWPRERAMELVDADIYGLFEMVRVERAARAAVEDLIERDAIPRAPVELDSDSIVIALDETQPAGVEEDASDPTWVCEGLRLARERFERRTR